MCVSCDGVPAARMVSAGGAVVLALVDSLLRRIVLPLVLAAGECVCIATETSN